MAVAAVGLLAAGCGNQGGALDGDPKGAGRAVKRLHRALVAGDAKAVCATVSGNLKAEIAQYGGGSCKAGYRYLRSEDGGRAALKKVGRAFRHDGATYVTATSDARRRYRVRPAGDAGTVEHAEFIFGSGTDYPTVQPVPAGRVTTKLDVITEKAAVFTSGSSEHAADILTSAAPEAVERAISAAEPRIMRVRDDGVELSEHAASEQGGSVEGVFADKTGRAMSIYISLEIEPSAELGKRFLRILDEEFEAQGIGSATLVRRPKLPL